MVSEFGPEEAENACRLIKDLKVPFGGTVADLIANTPKDCLMKYLVLEKVYSRHMINESVSSAFDKGGFSTWFLLLLHPLSL